MLISLGQSGPVVWMFLELKTILWANRDQMCVKEISTYLLGITPMALFIKNLTLGSRHVCSQCCVLKTRLGSISTSGLAR